MPWLGGNVPLKPPTYDRICIKWPIDVNIEVKIRRLTLRLTSKYKNDSKVDVIFLGHFFVKVPVTLRLASFFKD